MRTIGIVLAVAFVAAALHASSFAAQSKPTPASYDDALFDAIARAHGLPILKETSLPAGTREIRIRDDLTSGSYMPTPMLRLVQGPEGARGELLLFQRLTMRPGNPGPRADERCVPFGGDERICVRTWAPKPQDWRAVASRLDELGAWQIDERCEVVPGANIISGIFDVGSLSIQRLNGPSFSSYSCNAPTYRTTTDAGRKANAIYRFFRDLGGQVPYGAANR